MTANWHHKSAALRIKLMSMQWPWLCTTSCQVGSSNYRFLTSKETATDFWFDPSFWHLMFEQTHMWDLISSSGRHFWCDFLGSDFFKPLVRPSPILWSMCSAQSRVFWYKDTLKNLANNSIQKKHGYFRCVFVLKNGPFTCKLLLYWHQTCARTLGTALLFSFGGRTGETASNSFAFQPKACLRWFWSRKDLAGCRFLSLLFVSLVCNVSKWSKGPWASILQDLRFFFRSHFLGSLVGFATKDGFTVKRARRLLRLAVEAYLRNEEPRPTMNSSIATPESLALRQRAEAGWVLGSLAFRVFLHGVESMGVAMSG